MKEIIHRLSGMIPVGKMFWNIAQANPHRKDFGRPVKKASRHGKRGLNKNGHRGNRGK